MSAEAIHLIPAEMQPSSSVSLQQHQMIISRNVKAWNILQHPPRLLEHHTALHNLERCKLGKPKILN